VYTSVEPLRDAVSDADAPFMGCAQPFASTDAISIVPRIVLTDRVDVVAIRADSGEVVYRPGAPVRADLGLAPLTNWRSSVDLPQNRVRKSDWESPADTAGICVDSNTWIDLYAVRLI
jgi:hypothetical protein